MKKLLSFLSFLSVLTLSTSILTNTIACGDNNIPSSQAALTINDIQNKFDILLKKWTLNRPQYNTYKNDLYKWDFSQSTINKQIDFDYNPAQIWLKPFIQKPDITIIDSNASSTNPKTIVQEMSKIQSKYPSVSDWNPLKKISFTNSSQTHFNIGQENEVTIDSTWKPWKGFAEQTAKTIINITLNTSNSNLNTKNIQQIIQPKNIGSQLSILRNYYNENFFRTQDNQGKFSILKPYIVNKNYKHGYLPLEFYGENNSIYDEPMNILQTSDGFDDFFQWSENPYTTSFSIENVNSSQPDYLGKYPFIPTYKTTIINSKTLQHALSEANLTFDSTTDFYQVQGHIKPIIPFGQDKNVNFGWQSVIVTAKEYCGINMMHAFEQIGNLINIPNNLWNESKHDQIKDFWLLLKNNDNPTSYGNTYFTFLKNNYDLFYNNVVLSLKWDLKSTNKTLIVGVDVDGFKKQTNPFRLNII